MTQENETEEDGTLTLNEIQEELTDEVEETTSE